MQADDKNTILNMVHTIRMIANPHGNGREYLTKGLDKKTSHIAIWKTN